MLEDFLTLVRCENFTIAAERRNISQPAFSRRIKALEESIGADLLIHKHNKFQLTPTGKSFLLEAEKLLKHFNEVKSSVYSSSEMAKQHITIVTLNSISYTKSSLITQRINSLNENVAINFMVASVYNGIEMIKRNECDFFISYASDYWTPSMDKKLYNYVVIDTEKLVPVCNSNAPDYDLNNTQNNIPVMAHSAETIFGTSFNKMLEGKKDYRFIYTLESNYGSTFYNVLKGNSVDICWLPLSLVKDDLENKTLRHLGGGNWDIDFEIRMYVRSSSNHDLHNKILENMHAK